MIQVVIQIRISIRLCARPSLLQRFATLARVQTVYRLTEQRAYATCEGTMQCSKYVHMICTFRGRRKNPDDQSCRWCCSSSSSRHKRTRQKGPGDAKRTSPPHEPVMQQDRARGRGAPPRTRIVLPVRLVRASAPPLGITHRADGQVEGRGQVPVVRSRLCVPPLAGSDGG